MNAKVPIKQHYDDNEQSGSTLYSDCLDELNEHKIQGGPIYLELNGVTFWASSPGNVTVKLPRPWAVKLGLVSA